MLNKPTMTLYRFQNKSIQDLLIQNPLSWQLSAKKIIITQWWKREGNIFNVAFRSVISIETIFQCCTSDLGKKSTGRIRNYSNVLMLSVETIMGASHQLLNSNTFLALTHIPSGAVTHRAMMLLRPEPSVKNDCVNVFVSWYAQMFPNCVNVTGRLMLATSCFLPRNQHQLRSCINISPSTHLACNHVH